MTDYSMPELIARKRDGGELNADEVAWIVTGYTTGKIPDYQMSAFLMAVVCRGMSEPELAAWTEAMLHSGEVLELSAMTKAKVDKHSTGGVGDKVSIPLAPLVASCGVAVPMMSGRGLGHTGGTLDKLESIPGFRTDISPERFVAQLEEVGVVLAGQSETLVPADRAIYALRDATATVPSIPLIVSSIMSKKLAEDLDALVLDVKVGSGAFMKTKEDAETLARMMVAIGARHGTTVVAHLTDMSQPLGREVGNANEIRESLEVLRGEGPEDLVAVVLLLAEEMLMLGGVAPTRDAARNRLEVALSAGEGLETFRRVIAEQGGNPDVVDDPALLPSPEHLHELLAPRSGFVAECDALTVGRAAVRLGAGRARKDDAIDPAVGITIHAKRGEPVTAGRPLATVGWNDREQLDACLELLAGAWEIADEPRPERPLVLGEVR